MAGTPIGPLDLLIAAQARSLGATLVTDNAGEFKRVKGLKVHPWQPSQRAASQP
jgi:tRNA(fMet)-specific endonuclease VapC